MRHISQCLPGFAEPKTYAPWPIWRDSTTKRVVFVPLPKKEAVKLYHKARRFERQTRQPGRQDGVLGRNGLAVLYVLIFDFLDYATGQLDPAIKTIAKKALISERSAKRGLAKLKRAGVLNWIRRAGETHDEKGRFCLKQDTNAYGILPPSQWHDFIDNEPPPPHPSTWGATPPLPSVIEQAITETQDGVDVAAIIKRLEDDPGDQLAAAWARFGRAMQAREAREPH